MSAAETAATGFPDFLGVGVLKGGTTFLDRLLRQHPQVAMPVRLKETNYFSDAYDLGPAWYRRQYDVPPAAVVAGEICPTYATEPLAASRVVVANPAARIIFTVRDPWERVLSQHRHWQQETGFEGDVLAFIAAHPDAVQGSCYGALVQPWLEAFGVDQVLVVPFQELVRDPLATIRAIYRFVGVDEGYEPTGLDAPANVTATRRFPRSYHLAKRVTRRLNAAGLTQVSAWLRDHGGESLFRGQAAPPNQPLSGPPQASPGPPAWVVERFDADAAVFEALTGLRPGAAQASGP